MFPSLLIFWKTWERLVCMLSMFGRMSGPRLFVWRFLFTDLISLLVISLFKFSIASWINLGGLYMFLETDMFLPVCWIYFSVIVYSSLILFISVASVTTYVSFLIFLSLFIFMSLDRGLLILFIFSKNQLLISLSFLHFWINFIYALIFIIFFSSTNFELCLLFFFCLSEV